jgi:hypothetical protein
VGLADEVTSASYVAPCLHTAVCHVSNRPTPEFHHVYNQKTLRLD